MTFVFIGSEELAIGFRFVGVPGTVVATADEAREAFLAVTRGGEARVVIITEDVSAMIPREVMDWQMGGAYPLIVEIPGISRSSRGPHEPDRFHQGRRGNPRVGRECADGAERECADGAERNAPAALREQLYMETVRTSEALESQILEDARAKAARILDAADKECAAVRAEWDRKDEEEVRRLQGIRAARVAAMQQDLEASLPLDFLRSRLRFFQDSVTNALKSVFSSLDAANLGRLIGGQVARAAFAFINQHVIISCAGISEQEARRIVTASIPGAVVDEVKAMAPETAAETGTGLIVATSDGSRRFRATLQEISALLLEEHREELLKALFGNEVQK